MKASEIKKLIRESLLEIETSKDKMKKPSSSSGAMTPEEEKMIADYEEEMANKYAVGPKEEPELEEGKDVMSKAREIVSKHKGMMNEGENINSHSIKWNYPDTDPDSEDFYYERNPESRNYTISLPIYGTGPDGTMYKGLYVADVKSIEALDDLDIDPAKIDNIRRAEMNENEDSEDMYSYDKEVMEKGKVRQLKSKIIDAIDMIDPELHVETFAKVIANIVASEYGEHLYEDFLNALKAQTGSMTEGKEVVRQANRIVESWKRGKALVESKKAKRSKMLKENEDDDDESHGIVGADYLLDYAVSQFPQLVKQYGEEAVRLAFDVIYENSWHNYTEMVNVGSEDAEELAQIDVRKSVRQFKENPEELAQLIEDTMNDFNSSTT